MSEEPRRVLWWLVIALLLAHAARESEPRLAKYTGIDFYQYWNVGQVFAVTGGLAGSPYVNAESYALVMQEMARRSGGERLRAAELYRRRPNPNQTPFCYTLWSALPRSYEDALTLFQRLQITSLGIAVGLLGWSAAVPAAAIAVSGLAIFVAYDPIRSELQVGNSNFFQLAGFAVVFAILDLLQRLSRRLRIAVPAFLFVLLAAIVLLKPTALLMASALGVALVARLGARASLLALLAAVPGWAALVLLPCLHFRSGSIWEEWIGHVAAEEERERFVSMGNLAFAPVMAPQLGVEPRTISAATALFLIASLAWAFRLACRRRPPALVLASASRDAAILFAAALAITLAFSPLVWLHYYVLLLAPGIQLMQRRPLAALAAAAALFLASRPLRFVASPPIDPASGWPIALCWLPLWLAALLALQDSEPVPTPHPLTPEGAHMAEQIV